MIFIIIASTHIYKKKEGKQKIIFLLLSFITLMSMLMLMVIVQMQQNITKFDGNDKIH